MSTWIWVLVLVAAVWAAHWGAEKLAHPLKKLRRQWGFSAAAGGSFIGLAAASPEIGINIASAARGVADIGLGAAIGSNILAIPVVVTVAYVATRSSMIREGVDQESGKQQEQGAAQEGSGEDHEQHLEHRLLRIQKEAVTVQGLPYIAILLLFGALTLPAGWRGLQAVDGWILLGTYLVYLAQALMRGRKKGESVDWSKKEMALAVAGVAVLAIGAYFTVRSTENIVSALGIQQIIGGLFITAPMAVLPEVFAVWSVTRSGQVTSATTSVIGDHAVTMTVAFLPLALVGLPVQDLQLFAVNLGFATLVAVAYAALIHWGHERHGFTRSQVATLDGIYAAYLAVMLFWVLNIV